MSADLVIFDCDGVLIDSEPIANRVHADALTACGYIIGGEELLARFCGLSDATMLATIEREWGRRLPPAYNEQVAALLAAEYRRSLVPIAGVGAALAQLTLPVCVASSGTPEGIRLGLEIAGLYDHFAPNLFSAAMVERGKPAPDLLLLAATRMDAAPHRCIVVEDSAAGIEAACAAHMIAIGFCGGSHCRSGHEARLLSCGAIEIVANMRDLPAVISRISG